LIAVRVASGLALLVVLAGALVAVSAERPRLAGTNNVFDTFPNVVVQPGSEACAQDELVPGGTAAVRVRVTRPDPPAPPLELRLEQGGRELARGRLEEGWGDGPVDVPIDPAVRETQERVSVCFRNAGTVPATLWGYGAAGGPRAVVDGTTSNERTRLTYLRAGEESGWEVAGVVARRMGNVRGSLLDGWAFYGWLAALVGALAAAAVAVLRGWRG
jgi:hypothetical protein